MGPPSSSEASTALGSIKVHLSVSLRLCREVYPQPAVEGLRKLTFKSRVPFFLVTLRALLSVRPWYKYA